MILVVTIVLMTGNATAADAPVTIDGDSAMATYATDHSLDGDGSSLDPYIIEGLNIDANNGVNGMALMNIDLYVIIQNCVVNNTHNLNFNIGNGDGIFVTSSSHIQVCNNLVFDAYNGITIQNSHDCVVYGNTINNVTYANIKIASCTSVQVHHNFCADSYSGMTSIQSTHGCKFDNNTLLRNTYGFYISGSYQNILSDNYASANVYGISIESGSFGNKIDLNNCSANTYSGIYVLDDNNLIAANKVYGNLYSGIQINSADNCFVMNNICVNNPRGIYATGVNHITVSDNNCSRSSSYGFYANGCENITTSDNVMFFNTVAGIYLSNCRNSYLWDDVISRTVETGFRIVQSSWIYSTAKSTDNVVNGFSVTSSNNCTLAVNASRNGYNGVVFDACHLCRVIDSNIMANLYIGILTQNSDNSSILRVRAYLNQEGVELYNSDHEKVADCHLLGNAYGIWLSDATWANLSYNEIRNGANSGIILLGASGSDNCSITGNTINGFDDYGVHIPSSEHTTLKWNTISDNVHGVLISSVSHISLIENFFSLNLNGLNLISSDECVVSGNTFDGNIAHGVYAEDCADAQFLTNIFHNGIIGIELKICTNCFLEDNQIDASQWGAYVLNSLSTWISKGNITDSTGGGGAMGIYVHGGAGTIIQNVNVSHCMMGVLIEGTSSDVITNNIFYRNDDAGVVMYSCENAMLHHNQFLFNHGSTSVYSSVSNQAYDDNSGSNHWNTPAPDGIGNFWSDWCYPDVNCDGIVDAPLFILGGDEYDYFPIAEDTDPTVTITSPGTDGAVFTSDSVTLSWDATDTWSGLHHFEVYMDEGPWLNVGYGNIQTWTSLSDGQHHLHVKGVDRAGNDGTAVRMFIVDAGSPVATITTPGNHTAVNDSTPTISWTGTDAGMGVVYYNVGWDLEAYVSIGSAETYTFSSLLGDGSHTFYLRASDSNGHIRVYYLDFYVDTVAPSLDSLSPADGSVMSVKDIPVSWYAFDLAASPSGLDRTEVRLDSLGWIDKGLASTHTFLDVSEGFHSVYVRSFDKAGSSVEKQVRFLVDYTLPTITILTPANHTVYSVNTVTISWSGSRPGLWHRPL